MGLIGVTIGVQPQQVKKQNKLVLSQFSSQIFALTLLVHEGLDLVEHPLVKVGGIGRGKVLKVGPVEIRLHVVEGGSLGEHRENVRAAPRPRIPEKCYRFKMVKSYYWLKSNHSYLFVYLKFISPRSSLNST